MSTLGKDNLSMNKSLGVFPVFDIKFKISTIGVVASSAGMVTIAEMETFEPSIDGNVEEWTPMDTEGWVRRLMTGKGFGISLSGKRHYGDVGNDYVAGLAMKTGNDCSTTASIEFPNGDELLFDCVVNVSRDFGGGSINVNALEFELLSDGKPTYISSNALFTAFAAAQSGGKSKQTDTSAILFTFSRDMTSAGLTASKITLADGTGSATKGELTVTGETASLVVTNPIEGTVLITIALTGYQFPSKPVAVSVYAAE